MCFSILGTGSAVPDRIVTNNDLSKMVETSDEWIKKRVGVAQRRVCTSENAIDLGAEAAEKALESAGVKPEELDLILVATISGPYAAPSLAAMVQARIGASCPAYDISAACASFVFLLETAAGYFARKKVKKVLLVGTEQLSKIIDWSDRSTCVIFGDGAGAAVLGEGDSYISSFLHTEGGDDVIKVPTYSGTSPFSTAEEEKPVINMKGQETFKFAVRVMCHDVEKVLADAGVDKSEVAWVVPHQANLRIIDFAAKRLGMPQEKFYTNIEHYGNTSSASIPIALDEMNRKGLLKKGDKVVLTGFGGGLSSAACLVEW